MPHSFKRYYILRLTTNQFISSNLILQSAHDRIGGLLSFNVNAETITLIRINIKAM